MTDKEKIIAKIEQLMYGFNLEADIASCEDVETEKLANIKYQVCKKILEYIDSMQEESVSEELEEAADKYSNNDYNYFDVLVTEYDGTEHWMNDKVFIKDAFKAGAKWQKEQLIYKLKNKEVKEVDLQKEIDKEWEKCNPIDEGMGVESAFIHIEAFDMIVRHFFELGLKTQKGE